MEQITETLKAHLTAIEGKALGLVYAYRGEKAIGFEHYDYWKSDVISDWLKACEELKCIPYILDARTFSEKSFSNTLPQLDAVINLNAGTKSLSTLGLIPSICSVLNTPCIPGNTAQVVTGEDKHFSNLIAKSIGLNVPEYEGEDSNLDDFIARPRSFGSSFGVERGKPGSGKDIKQRFIKGFDVTVPLLYNPTRLAMEVLPGVLYHSHEPNIEWYLSNTEKNNRNGYAKKIVHLDHVTKELLLEMAEAFNTTTYCRMDFRVQCNSVEELESVLHRPIQNRSLYFLEINTMPTIKESVNFVNSLDSKSTNGTAANLDLYKRLVSGATSTGYILFSSMVGLLLKAKH